MGNWKYRISFTTEDFDNPERMEVVIKVLRGLGFTKVELARVTFEKPFDVVINEIGVYLEQEGGA